MNSCTLRCNKACHQSESIYVACMKQGCEAPIPCCVKCMMEDHNDHKLDEFKEIPIIRTRFISSLSYLQELSQTTEQFLDECFQWKKKVNDLILEIKDNSQLVENPNLSQLTYWVLSLKNQLNRQKQNELVQNYKNQLNYVKLTLQQLQSETKEILQDQLVLQNKKSQDGENLDLKKIKFSLTQQIKGHQHEVGIVAISNKDQYLATGSNKSCYVWDLGSKSMICQFKTEFTRIFALQFSIDTTMLAVSSSIGYGVSNCEGIVEIFDLINVKDNQVRICLRGHRDRIDKIIFTDDSKYLISASFDQSLRIWDLKKQNQVHQYNCENELQGAALSSKKHLIACCDRKGQAYIFDYLFPSNLNFISKWQAHNIESVCIEFIQRQQVIVTSSLELTRFWFIEELKNNIFRHFKQIQQGGQTIQAYPDVNPQVIMNCSINKKFINLWNYESTELIQSIEIPNELSRQSFVTTKDFKFIITGGRNKNLNIFQVDLKKKISKMTQNDWN